MDKFTCPECGAMRGYDMKTKTLECSGCGNSEPLQPRKTSCFCCHEPYLEYTYYDPSGCDRCHRSFVD